jgi:ABC-type nickel/cobalt efflux system permease component RcnA
MSLSEPKSVTKPAAESLLSTHTILLLSGVLFGMSVSSALPREVKLWFVLTGTTGLIAYFALMVVARKKLESMQRAAAAHAELRLERHAQHESRHDWSQPESAEQAHPNNDSGMTGVAPGCVATNAPN